MDIEKIGGSLDHLSEAGLRSLVRDLQTRIYNSEAERDRFKTALTQIADRQHEEPLPKCGCTCYFGDNGYTCGQPIAEAALAGQKDGVGE